MFCRKNIITYYNKIHDVCYYDKDSKCSFVILTFSGKICSQPQLFSYIKEYRIVLFSMKTMKKHRFSFKVK